MIGRRSFTYWLAAGVILFVLVCLSVGAYQSYRFNHMSPDEHLSAAHQYVRDFNYDAAQKHLNAIPQSSLAHDSYEFDEVADAIAKHKAELAEEAAAQAEAQQVYAAQQVQPKLRCGIQTATGEEFMSVDGKPWVPDDGRCIDLVLHDDAKNYRSTTIRVNTDMNQGWLNEERRNCTSYPNDRGRVSTLSCSDNLTRADRNIPVTFWGKVDRGHPSIWKCERQKNLLDDRFVCWALD